MSCPRVSVLMPVFNAAATVAAALESIRRQSFLDWELIAVDDGSSDESATLLQKAAREEPRLKLARSRHAGIVAALNRGLEEATAPLIARMDADDESDPARLMEQVSLLDASPGLGVVGCLVRFGGDAQSAGGYALHVDWINTLITPADISLNRFIESPFAHPSVVFRRDLVARHGGYRDGDFPEDYELWLRWLEAGVQMAKVPRMLLTWRDSPGRLSRHSARYDVEAFYRCKAQYLARWLQGQVDPARRLLIWGAGRPTRKRADHLRAHGVAIAGYIDIDPAKIGRAFAGSPVLSPEDLPEPARCFVLGYVGKRGARELARAHLRARGFVEGRDFVMAA